MENTENLFTKEDHVNTVKQQLRGFFGELEAQLKLVDSMEQIELHPMSDRITSENFHIFADKPGAGNGSHLYSVVDKNTGETVLDVDFQHGALSEKGLNGVSTGTILQILIHHLKGFQSGPFSSRETSIVITKLEEAMQWTKQRELDREQRGVLGKEEK